VPWSALIPGTTPRSPRRYISPPPARTRARLSAAGARSRWLSCHAARSSRYARGEFANCVTGTRLPRRCGRTSPRRLTAPPIRQQLTAMGLPPGRRRYPDHRFAGPRPVWSLARTQGVAGRGAGATGRALMTRRRRLAALHAGPRRPAMSSAATARTPPAGRQGLPEPESTCSFPLTFTPGAFTSRQNEQSARPSAAF